MEQFWKILKFELKGYLTNKVFVGVTAFLMAVIVAVTFFPRVMDLLGSGGDEGGDVPEVREVMLVSGGDERVREVLSEAFPGYEVRLESGDVRAAVTGGEADCAVELHGLSDFTYYVDNLSMYDENAQRVSEALTGLYRLSALTEAGLTEAQAGEIMSSYTTFEIRSLGVDQGQNFFYTYVMIFALYMVILLYGQMVASNVAAEKSSRAMELLVTSAKPNAMMFGKVVASCLAGLLQLVCVFGSALLCYNVNREFMDEGGIVSLLFNMPPALLGYMLLFFMLGFFLYAFLYGAIGSTASKLEDINTSVMPVTLLFLAGFFVVVYGMTSGNVDNTLMVICSYVPFTSPMAMFTRIAMSHPAVWEIVLSVAVLFASCLGVGVLSARIYRAGVLLYGASPRIGEIVKLLRKA